MIEQFQNFSHLSDAKIIKICSDLTAINSVVFSLLLYTIFALVIGFWLVKEDRGKLALIIFISLILSLIISLTVIYFIPNSISQISNRLMNT